MLRVLTNEKKPAAAPDGCRRAPTPLDASHAPPRPLTSVVENHAPSASHRPARVSALQGAYGNQAVLRMLRRAGEKRDGDVEPAEVPPFVYDAINSAGSPLDAGTRSFMESRMGYDFGRVRVHTDARAAASADALDAAAYTLGHDVVFGPGRYGPGTGEGLLLLAHELTHVAQQSGGGRAVAPSSLEQEASSVARRVAGGGGPARPHHTAAVGVAKQDKDQPKLDFYQNAFYANRRFAQTLPGWPGDPGFTALWDAARIARQDEAAGWTKPEFRAFADAVRRYQRDVMKLVGAQATGAIGPKTLESLRTGSVYEQRLKEGADKLRKPAGGIGFQRCDVKLEDISNDPKFDAEYWEVTDDPDPDPKFGKMLKLKKKPAHEAIDKIFEHPEKWTFDCAQFVQVLELYTRRHALGDVEFDKLVGNMTLRVQGSSGLQSEMLYVLGESLHSPGGSKTIDMPMMEGVLASAPIGSRVVWQNPKVPAGATMQQENSVKVGKDLYAAHGLGSQTYFTRQQLQAEFASITKGSASDIVIAEIEIYKRPIAP